MFPYGYFVGLRPSPVFVGVLESMQSYAMDYVLFTNAKVKDDVVYKILDTMVKNKPDMVAVAPIMNDFSADSIYRKHDLPYHPGALKYFQDNKLQAKGLLGGQEVRSDGRP